MSFRQRWYTVFCSILLRYILKNAEQSWMQFLGQYTESWPGITPPRVEPHNQFCHSWLMGATEKYQLVLQRDIGPCKLVWRWKSTRWKKKVCKQALLTYWKDIILLIRSGGLNKLWSWNKHLLDVVILFLVFFTFSICPCIVYWNPIFKSVNFWQRYRDEVIQKMPSLEFYGWH